MLLRSSSTPVAQALFSESASRGFESNFFNDKSHTNDHCITKISVPHGTHVLRSFSCNSSPAASHSNPWLPDTSPELNNLTRKSIRRSVSDGNLKELASKSFDTKEVGSPRTLFRKSLPKHSKSMLHKEPSLSIYNTDDKEERGHGNPCEWKLERSATTGESIEPQFSFGKNMMCKIDEGDNEQEEEEKCGSLTLFKDLKFEMPKFDGKNDISFDDGVDLENYYKRMVNEDASNPLFLRNYAQLLQLKGDLGGAEEYYSRAILRDPRDGQTLMQYAKLMWDVYRDQDKACTYFERASQAAPEDSHVLAAHASFLWEVDDDEDEDCSPIHLAQTGEGNIQIDFQRMDFEDENRPASPPLHLAMGLGIDMPNFPGSVGTGIEEYYRSMVDENPRNNLVLRNYAQFLHQSKGDLIGAEEFYSRAILADPTDGEIISQYANLVWQLHRDKNRAASYFERAVQATPDDCHILASYAKFLWDAEDGIEDVA